MSPASVLKIRCPRCATEFRIPPSQPKAECPKCHARMSVTVSEKTPGQAAAAHAPSEKGGSAEAPPTAAKSEKVADPNSFVSYLKRHFSRWHGSAVWGAAAGLVAAPLLSLAKHWWGFGAPLVVFEVVVVVAVTAGLAYTVEQYLAFVLWKQGKAGEDVRGWQAPFIYGCLTFLIPLGILVAVESLTPRYGLVATIIPPLRTEEVVVANRWDDTAAAASSQQLPSSPATPMRSAKVQPSDAAAKTSAPISPAAPSSRADNRSAVVPQPTAATPAPPAATVDQPPPKEPPPMQTAPAADPEETTANEPAEEAAPAQKTEVEPSPAPKSGVVESLFVIHAKNEQGPLIQGAKVELWHQAGKSDKPVPLGSAVTNSRGTAKIEVDFGERGPAAGEYGVTVSRGSVSKSWILSDYPEAAGWNLCLPEQ
ncbi:MAG: hypothetical protein GXY83_30750 [Rhodopirellula sp.]|nr:hypothetical protein [Rhodopirellula sp.]